MTTLSEQMAGDDLSVFFNTDEFSETVTYNNGTADAEVTAVLDTSIQIPGVNGRTAMVYVTAEQVTAPAYRHTFVQADGTIWTVFQDANNGALLTATGVWEIPVNRSERFKGWNK